MENTITYNKLISDGTEYFTNYGSKNTFLLVNEEIDNLIGACPTYGGFRFVKNFKKYNIEIYNDGITPTMEEMANMHNIGKTNSKKQGPGLCGMGQIESLVACRERRNSTSALNFTSIHGGKMSTYTCSANGEKCEIKTSVTSPIDTDEPDSVTKTFTNVYVPEDEKKFFNEVKLHIAAKIFPYMCKHPNFVFEFNGEQITPIDLLYTNITEDNIQKKTFVYKFNYKNNEYNIKCDLIDFSRYVKPDGFTINEINANEYDAYHKFSRESTGVYLEIADVYVVMGGFDSWKHIGKSQHSTHNGQRVVFHIPEGLKDLIFGENARKSSIGEALYDMKDNTNSYIFRDFINNKIKTTLEAWVANRNKLTNDNNIICKAKEKELYNEILNKPEMASVINFFDELSDEMKCIIKKKYIKTMITDYKNNKKEIMTVNA